MDLGTLLIPIVVLAALGLLTSLRVLMEYERGVVYLTGYHPTPLTTAEQIYRSRLTMAAPNEPGELVVEVLSTLESRPHLRICAAFSREAIEAVPLPLAQTVEAAARVMAVARDLGVDVAGPLGRVVGAIASAHLPWGETVEEAPPSSCAA